MAGATRAIADFSWNGRPVGAPEAAIDLAIRSLIDTLGVLFAGRQDESVDSVLSAAASNAELSGDATILVDGRRSDPATAALINGTAAHALDFDLGGLTQQHPGAVIWPAVLAVGEAADVSGKQLVEAAIVGFEVAAGVAAGMDMRGHYERWHATATVSRFGAAMAVGRLMGLNPDQLRCALGITASMAAGSRQNFGTMTKPLHAGLAAQSGVFAAEIAAHDFTADMDQLEAPQGFFSMYSPGPNPQGTIQSLANPWALLNRGLSMKAYPCCYSAHRAIAGTIALRTQIPRVDEVDSINVTFEPNGLESLIHHSPVDGTEGKFSAEYLIAAALLDGGIALSSFTGEALARPELRRLMSRVRVSEAQRPPIGPPGFERFYAVVEISFGHDKATTRVDSLPSDKMATAPLDLLENKFRDCIAYSGLAVDPARLLREIWTIQEVASCRELSLFSACSVAARDNR
ncbi:MAG: MmgE/PrpD family protein [Acidimicrobiales bacterium]